MNGQKDPPALCRHKCLVTLCQFVTCDYWATTDHTMPHLCNYNTTDYHIRSKVHERTGSLLVVSGFFLAYKIYPVVAEILDLLTQRRHQWYNIFKIQWSDLKIEQKLLVH